MLFQKAQKKKSGTFDFPVGEDVFGVHIFRDGKPVLPREEQPGGIHVYYQKNSRFMDGSGDRKVFSHSPAVQDQPVNTQGFPPDGVFQVGVFRADEIGLIVFLDRCGHDGSALHSDSLKGLAESA